MLRADGSTSFTFMSFGRDGAVRQDSWPQIPECTMDYAREYAGKDLRVRRVLGGRRGVSTTDDLLSPDEIARCPVHQEHYRQFPDAWNSLFHTVKADDRLMIPCSSVPPPVAPSGMEEKARLRILSPHIARAYHLNDLLPAGGVFREGLLGALDGLEEGVFLLDRDGTLAHANAAGRMLLDARDALRLERGVLSAAHAGSRDALQRFVLRSLLALNRVSFALPPPVAIGRLKGAPLIMRSFVCPDERGVARVLLKVKDSSLRSDPSIDTIRAVSGFTASEARIALALMGGDSIPEVAAAAGIAQETVRTHLRNMRGKPGVRRYSEIVGYLSRVTQI
ncbi:helix-turn-helix transcriptional regulator [Aurantimonas sp. A2-1-M11]|uniref:helix-turn-helix transcriptional regulator n=1 Tax=Aurantimonas sp. A2-1-M11 TaxID=3113712 RepID=UPI002F923BBA